MVCIFMAHGNVLELLPIKDTSMTFLAPKLYRLAWAVVEPVLTGRTISKIEIYGTNKDEWKSRLIEECGADNLPSYCGGAITTCFSVCILAKQLITIFQSGFHFLRKKAVM